MYYFLPLPILILVLIYAHKQAFDKASVALILASLALCYFHFYTAQWEGFSIDSEVHAAYVKIIADKDRIPTTDETAAARHPPTYYLACAALYKLAKMTHANDPMLTARHFSMLCYVMFMLFSVTLLRQCLSPPNASYYMAVALVVFWPLGITMGGRITCDILLYAATAGVLASLAQWMAQKFTVHLRSALLWAGIAALTKNAGVLMVGLTCAVLALAVWQHRRTFKTWLKWDVVLALLFALGACYYTSHQAWIMDAVPAKHTYNFPYWWRWFTSFNLFVLLYETQTGLGQDSFWNVMLHSLLEGNVLPWKGPNIILVLLNIMWLAVLAYMTEGLATYFRRMPAQDKNILKLLGVFTLIMIAAMMVMSVMTGNVGYADARYLYPVVIGVALGFGKALQGHERTGAKGAQLMGIGFASAMVALTCALFMRQYFA